MGDVDVSATEGNGHRLLVHCESMKHDGLTTSSPPSPQNRCVNLRSSVMQMTVKEQSI